MAVTASLGGIRSGRRNMPGAFDPYYRWLSIPPEDQPPTHYRLLGVKQFENDLDVIESAADRQMAHVRSFQTGKHATWSQKLLNELAAAKHCLLSSTLKSEYDRGLRARPEAAAPPAAKPAMVATKVLPTARALPAAAPAAQAAPADAGFTADIGFDPLAQRGPVRRAAAKQSPLTLPVLAGGGVALAVAVVAAWIMLGDRSDEPREQKVQPVASVRSGDDPKTLTAEGPAAPADTARSGAAEAAKESAPWSSTLRPARPSPAADPTEDSGASSGRRIRCRHAAARDVRTGRDGRRSAASQEPASTPRTAGGGR